MTSTNWTVHGPTRTVSPWVAKVSVSRVKAAFDAMGTRARLERVTTMELRGVRQEILLGVAQHQATSRVVSLEYVELRDVTVAFDGVRALEDVNLVIQPGERIGLTGRTGSGSVSTTSTPVVRWYAPIQWSWIWPAPKRTFRSSRDGPPRRCCWSTTTT